MNYSNSVKIVEQSHVSPPPLPAGEVRPSLPLTFFDMLWLNYSPVERLFFYKYPNSTSHFLCVDLPILKSALSSALSTFYPLAATIRRRSNGRFEIATAESDAVSLTVSEYVGDAADFLDISSDNSRPIKNLLPLVPQLPKSRDSQPLLALQLTLFPNHGLCIALALHHSACDGFSSMQFVRQWSSSAAAASGFRPETPVMDRAVIPDPRNLYSHMERVVLDDRAEEKMVLSGMDDGVFAATFTLSAPDIVRLKKAAEKRAPCFRYSTFVVSCAYSWICLLKTRRAADRDGKARLLFAADWRRRSRVAIPANYFGNCVGGCFVKWDADELLSSDGVLVGCEAIGKGIEELGDDANKSMDGVMDRIAEFAPFKPLTFAGSNKMGVYEVDFGWGKPEKVEVISTRETGAIAIAESRDGEGGMEIGVILPEEDLNRFAQFFAAGLDWLSD